jgi:hypothetical protein
VPLPECRMAVHRTDVSTNVAPCWMGPGYSADGDALTAGRRAAEQAVDGRVASLLLVFAPTSCDLERLLDGVRSCASHGTVIAGCTSMGGVVAGYPDPPASGVVVVALGGPGLHVRAQVGRNVSARRREAGAEAASSVAGLKAPRRICLLLCDGLVGDQHEVVRGAYGVLGATVPMVGGCAGDDLTYTRTQQFLGDRAGVEILTDAVVGVGLGSAGGFGVGIAHGWRKVGEPAVVTSSSGGRLFQLDGRPALDAYLDWIGADRTLHDGDVGDGSLLCLADIPQGALAWLMEPDDEALVEAAASSCAQAIENLDGARPQGLLLFNCGVRKVMLGEAGMQRELAAVAKVGGDVPFGGFFTYGEIARTRGARGMHHLTVVTLAMA